MLCSKCSEVVKPIVAIDIDGTLGDYHGHFLRFASAYLGGDLENLLEASVNMYTGGIPFSEYCMSLFGITLQEYRDIKLAYRQGAMKRSMPIYQHAVALCRSVKAAGIELWMTTTRPYLSLDGVIKDTEFWLRHHAIEYDGLLFDDDKYVTLAERVDSRRVIAVLDDVDEMYDSAAKIMHFGNDATLLYVNNYNVAMAEGRNCVYNLLEAAHIILSRAEDWRRAHA